MMSDMANKTFAVALRIIFIYGIIEYHIMGAVGIRCV